MSSGTTDHLVHDINQISRYFATYPRDEAVAGIVDHIVKFWERRMREQMAHHVATGGAGMDELALAAAKALPLVKARQA
jgi:formate dehydrogenase subunit delta